MLASKPQEWASWGVDTAVFVVKSLVFWLRVALGKQCKYFFCVAFVILCALIGTVGAQDHTVPPTPPARAEDTVSYLYGPMYRIPFITTPSMPDGANIAINILEWNHYDNQTWPSMSTR